MQTSTPTSQPAPPCSGAPDAYDELMAQAALESARLAIARWTGGIHLPQMLVPGLVRVSPQARWYAMANNHFQAWLDEGGFARPPEQAETLEKPAVSPARELAAGAGSAR